MTRKQFIKEVEKTAEAARSAGQTIEINRRLPYVAVTTGEDEYFFQGQDAQELLDSVPDYLDAENCILWLAQGW